MTLISAVIPVAKQFEMLCSQEDNLNMTEHNGAFWKSQRDLRENLQLFITQEDFSVLSGEQVVRLCQMVLRHRPVEPTKFLIRCDAIAKPTKHL